MSLIDDSRGIIYNRNMFIIQTTEGAQKKFLINFIVNYEVK